MITEFSYRGQVWFWNGFAGFFFQPVSETRKKERFVREGRHALYDTLREAAGHP
jgi:hypothetical protein